MKKEGNFKTVAHGSTCCFTKLPVGVIAIAVLGLDKCGVQVIMAGAALGFGALF